MFVISLCLLLWEVNCNGILKSELEILCCHSHLKASGRYSFFSPSLLFIFPLNIKTFQLLYLVLADVDDFNSAKRVLQGKLLLTTLTSTSTGVLRVARFHIRQGYSK